MGFHEHKITAFTHKITDLPDQPTLSPQELKARFDSSPEELRKAVNGICDEGERLSARVEGIVTDTFGDTIDREMLSHELAAELDAKADEASVAKRLTSEQTARENADAALSTRLSTVEGLAAQKCEVYSGTYKGNGERQQHIDLGFTPDALLLCRQNYSGDYRTASFALNGFPGWNPVTCTIEENGFQVYVQDATAYTNLNGTVYLYLAFRFTKTTK